MYVREFVPTRIGVRNDKCEVAGHWKLLPQNKALTLISIHKYCTLKQIITTAHFNVLDGPS
jgi:hypothetical protein